MRIYCRLAFFVDPRQSPRTTRLPTIVGTDFPYALFTLAADPYFLSQKKSNQWVTGCERRFLFPCEGLMKKQKSLLAGFICLV